MFKTIIKWFLRLGWIGIMANEIRGIVIAAPILYGMFVYGETWMQWWVGICMLIGIFLSVVIPTWVLRWIERRFIKPA